MTAKHEGVTVLKPEYAQRDGARPFVCATNDQLQAVWALAGEWLASGYPAFSVCIATANPDVVSVRQISDAAPVGIKTSRLTGDYLQRTDIVVVSDIYNIKGFEFSLIVIVGLGDGEFPPKGVPVGETWREALRLYVAMTRGRDEVCLVHQGTPSPFIRAMSGTLTPRPLTFAKIIPVPLPAAPEFIPDDPKEKPQPKPSIDVAAPIPLIVPTSATVPEPEPVQPTAPPAFIPISGEPEVAPSKNEPEEMVLNGVTLLVMRGEPSVRSVARALGRNLTQVHNDFMSLGVFTAPDAPVVRAFVYRVMEKYGCSPVFRRS